MIPCEICSIDNSGYCPPDGVDDPEVYFVGMTPGEEEIKSIPKRVFVGKAGQILRTLIKDLEITKYRLYNVVACRTSDQEGGNRNPTDEEIMNCSGILKEDIRKHRPGYIVLLGERAIKAFIPEYEGSVIYAIEHVKIDFEGIPIIISYHPSYIARKGGIKSLSYQNEFYLPIKSRLEELKTPSNSHTHSYTILCPSDIPLLKEYLPDDEISLDIETCSLETYSQDFRILGIGLSNKKNNYYLCIKSFEDDFYDDYLGQLPELYKFLKSKKRILIYNLSMEGKAFFNEFKEHFNFWDIYQDVKTLGSVEGLKAVVYRKLNISDWGDEVWTIASSIKDLVWILRPKKRGTNYQYEDFKVLGIEGTIAKYSEIGVDNLTKNGKKVLEVLTLLKNYYYEVDYERVTNIILERVNIFNFELAMDMVYVKTMAKYCTMDTAILFPLEIKLLSEMSLSESTIARDIYQVHAKIGIDMELNAISWDDEYASYLDNYYEERLLYYIKKILSHPLYVKANSLYNQKLLTYIVSKDRNELLTEFNPQSNHEDTKVKFIKAIDTTDLRLAKVLRYFEEELSEEKKSSCVSFKSILDNNHIIRERFLAFKTLLSDSSIYNKLSRYELVCLKYIVDHPLESLNSSSVEELYKVLTEYMGVLIDDQSTWIPEMWLLYYYRSYKKISKNLSTYINGDVGRGSVWVVDKKLYESGEYTSRKRRYDYNNINEDERYILQPEYRVNNAITKRWQSAIHTLPWTCLTGDTEIPLLDGTVRNIADLEGMSKFWVYSYDIDKKEIVPGLVKHVKKTRLNTLVMRVHLDNGRHFDVTPDHRILTLKGYKEVRDLRRGDSLRHFELKKDINGYIYVINPNTGEDGDYVHNIVYDFKNYSPRYWKDYGSCCIHHKDFNKENNSPENLIMIPWKLHTIYHSKNANKTLSKIWLDEEFVKAHKERGKILIKNCHKKQWSNEQFRKEHALRNRYRLKSPESRRKHKEASKSMWLNSVIRPRLVANGIKNLNNSKEHTFNIFKKRIGLLYEELIKRNLIFNEENWYNLKREIRSHWTTPGFKNIFKYYKDEEDLVAYINDGCVFNNKVVNIEVLNYQDTYDLDVERYHNFALSAGVFVHNSELRDCHTTRFDDGLILHVDYSQMEIRILAAMSKDKDLLSAFIRGDDIHMYMASRAFLKDPKDITSAERRFSKMLSFSIIYGKTVKGAAADFLQGDLKRAENLFNGFYNGFPLIMVYFKDKTNELVNNGYVTTLFGDRIYIPFDPDWEFTDKGRYNTALRAVRNYPIQSSASTIGGLGIYNYNKLLESNNMLRVAKVFGFTHDSSDTDIRTRYLFDCIKFAEQTMVLDINKRFNLPVAIDIEIGLKGNSMVGLEIEDIGGDKLIKFEGIKKNVEAVVSRLSNSYNLVDFNILKEEERLSSLSELFITRRAYSMELGKKQIIQEGSFIIKGN